MGENLKTVGQISGKQMQSADVIRLAPVLEVEVLPSNDARDSPAETEQTSLSLAAIATIPDSLPPLSTESATASKSGDESLAASNNARLPSRSKLRFAADAAAKVVQSAAVMLTPRSLSKSGSKAPSPARAPPVLGHPISLPRPRKLRRASGQHRTPQAASGSPPGLSASHGLDNGEEPMTLLGIVARDAKSSPSWRRYQLNKQVWKMMIDKDRALPMTPGARSPRHLMERSKRIVAPAKPKAVAKKRKVTAEEMEAAARIGVVVDDVPLSCWDRVRICFGSIGQAICSVWDGFLGQDLEVQLVVIFFAMSAAISSYNQLQRYYRLSQYEAGAAPPAPPSQPVWTAALEESTMGYALKQPSIFLLIDFGIAIIIGIIVLFWEDIRAWQKARELRSRGRDLLKKGYAPLKSKTAEEKVVDREGSFNESQSPRSKAAAIDDPDDGVLKKLTLKSEADVRRELARSSDRVEELELKLKVHSSTGSASSSGLADRLNLHRERRRLLTEALHNLGGDTAEKASSTPTSSASAVRGGGSILSDISSSGLSTVLTILKNSANGFISVYIFFLDVYSDIQVIVLLWDTGNLVWCAMATFCLVAQYVVVYFRVLPYMRNTFGKNSCLTCTFIYLGFPAGLLIFDFLMLLEPFGLLAVLPLPAWLKQFVPAYKATRVITEIAIESLPQCILQSYIIIVVVQQVAAGTANEHILAMVDDASLMPKSILISTLAILKTWIEVVQQSREAGISVATKASQLWHVGAGLPLDALKKGSITDWACAYELDQAEIPPLLDALIKNTSLSALGLSKTGLEWDAAEGNAAPLVEAIANNPVALSGLETLVISKTSEYRIPIGGLRAGPERALQVLSAVSFFAKGQGSGPWHTDLMVCGDVLRSNGKRNVITEGEAEATDEVAQILEDARAGSLARETWEQRTKQLMSSGNLRRSHLRCLVGAEILRDLGLRAAQLLGTGFDLFELKNGQFTVDELRECGVSVRDLSATRYSAEELREGGVTAEELKPLDYEPHVLRAGGFSAAELRIAKYALADLKGVYTTGELYAAEFPAKEMRQVGFEVAELKAAQWAPDLLRRGGYSAAEMKEGGYEASQVRIAGYSATEATSAGWTLQELKGADYGAADLRQAKHTAAAMREVGFAPNELRNGKYPTEELYAAGFSAEELRKAGTSISDLTAAGATIAEMHASGVSAGGLKIENVRLKDMRLGGYTAKEVKAAGYGCKEVKLAGYVKGVKAAGYTIDEAVAANFSCEELFHAGYSAEELLGVGFAPMDMRAVGYDANQLAAVGVTLPKLRSAGVSVADLRSAGFSCVELRLVGVDAKELQAVKVPVAELKDGGYTLKEVSDLYAVGELRDCGFSCEELRNAGFSVKDVHSSGASNKELRDGGFSAGELRQIGVLVQELRKLQYTSAELKECGFTAKDLSAIGYDAYSLKNAGYRARHVKECGFKGCSVFRLEELRADGFGVEELLGDEGFTLEQMSKVFNVEELRTEGGITAVELLETGFTLTQMREGGFGAADLYNAGYAVHDMKIAGYTCEEVREAGYVEGLKAAGYTCKEARAAGLGADLKRAGYLVEDLKGAGCSVAEVRAAGYVKDLKAAGYTCREACMARFPAKLLRGAGFSCAEAKKAGYVKDLKTAGFTPTEAREVGCTCEEARGAGYIDGLAAAGYTIEECFEANYSCDQARKAGFVEGFKAAGYTIKEASVAGFSAEGFRTAGYTCEDFKIAQFTCSQAKAAGYSAKDCKSAGWSWLEIGAAGYVLRPAGWKGFMQDMQDTLDQLDLTDAGLKAMFITLDTDGSGKIDDDEMRAAIIKTYGDSMPDSVIDEMMRAADTDHDGEVDLDEFKAIMRAGPGSSAGSPPHQRPP